MGARLVKKAYVFALDVPLHPNEFRLLCWMAMTAIDDDVTPRYFDSREASALALGRRVVDAGYGDAEDQRERVAAFEAVKVALRGLCAVGAIRRVTAGRNGRRSEYAIALDAISACSLPEVRKRTAKEGSAFPQRKVQPSPKGRSGLPSTEGSAFPQGTSQDTQGTTAGITPPYSPDLRSSHSSLAVIS